LPHNYTHKEEIGSNVEDSDGEDQIEEGSIKSTANNPSKSKERQTANQRLKTEVERATTHLAWKNPAAAHFCFFEAYFSSASAVTVNN